MESTPEQIIALTFSLLKSKSVLVSIPWKEQTNWFFHDLEVKQVTTFFPSLETFLVEATGNSSKAQYRSAMWNCGWDPLILNHHPARFGVHRPNGTRNNGVYTISSNSKSSSNSISNAKVPIEAYKWPFWYFAQVISWNKKTSKKTDKLTLN